jgi:hypothetical protein
MPVSDIAARIAAGELAPGTWRPLTTPADLARFVQIMERMDERYDGMGETLDRWLASRVATGHTPELFGWSPLDDAHTIHQVIAITSRPDDAGQRRDLHIRRLGVDPDLVPQDQRTDAHVRAWLARFLLLLLELSGPGHDMQAMRPKTMTFRPMQRMHDLMREGLVLEDGGRTYRAAVVDERDRVAALMWMLRIDPLPAA